MIFKNFRKGSPGKQKAAQRTRTATAGPSIITADVVIDGTLISGGELQIDGTVNGDVRARAAVVDGQGVVHGEVAAEEVFVRGRVIGPIRGVRVNMQAGSHVEGDVLSESISVENGAHIEGKIRHSDDPLNEASPSGYKSGHDAHDALDHPHGHVGYDGDERDHDFGVYDEEGFRPVSRRKSGDAAE